MRTATALLRIEGKGVATGLEGTGDAGLAVGPDTLTEDGDGEGAWFVD